MGLPVRQLMLDNILLHVDYGKVRYVIYVSQYYVIF
jgi:hypothetical protein